MASLQDIRRRIKSVQSTQKITRAMNMVAAAHLRRAQAAAKANEPYAMKMAEVVNQIASNAGDFSHPLLKQHEDGKVLYLVMAADKGLAGAYSSNVFKETQSHIPTAADAAVITVGRKTKEFFKNRQYEIVESYTGISERPAFEHAREIADKLINLYSSGEYKEIYMVYSVFKSAISCIPVRVQLLPFKDMGVDEGAEKEGMRAEYIYEPSAADVLGYLLPQYLVTTIYAALLQASASELSSRMNAMSNATDNAEELLKKLDLHYNKVRQAGITSEITEIVGGAEALK